MERAKLNKKNVRPDVLARRHPFDVRERCQIFRAVSINIFEFMVKSKSWHDILKFYQNLNMQNMAEFVEHISKSEYAYGIYATTSMHSLWISQNPEFEIDKNMLRIEFANDTFVFIYKESPYSNKEWRKESDKYSGFTTFEHIMRRLKWFLN